MLLSCVKTYVLVHMMPKRMITGHVNNWRCHDIAMQQQTCGVVKLLFVLLLAITGDVVETQLIHILR